MDDIQKRVDYCETQRGGGCRLCSGEKENKKLQKKNADLTEQNKKLVDALEATKERLKFAQDERKYWYESFKELNKE